MKRKGWLGQAKTRSRSVQPMKELTKLRKASRYWAYRNKSRPTPNEYGTLAYPRPTSAELSIGPYND